MKNSSMRYEGSIMLTVQLNVLTNTTDAWHRTFRFRSPSTLSLQALCLFDTRGLTHPRRIPRLTAETLQGSRRVPAQSMPIPGHAKRPRRIRDRSAHRPWLQVRSPMVQGGLERMVRSIWLDMGAMERLDEKRFKIVFWFCKHDIRLKNVFFPFCKQ